MTALPPETAAPPGKPAGRCPICGKPTRHEVRPFCSVRCRDVDLARWFGGTYRVPGEPLADADGSGIGFGGDGEKGG